LPVSTHGRGGGLLAAGWLAGWLLAGLFWGSRGLLHLHAWALPPSRLMGVFLFEECASSGRGWVCVWSYQLCPRLPPPLRQPAAAAAEGKLMDLPHPRDRNGKVGARAPSVFFSQAAVASFGLRA